MIQSLYIKNFALIDELKINFSGGLNVLTGETGAGKSIIVNAIAQLCGERASVELVRSGVKKAIIEALFCVEPWPEIIKLAEDLNLDMPDFKSIIIRKEMNTNGNTRSFINDSPVTLNNLTAFSSLLVDLHGQHQHQRLLHPENHIGYLDSYAANGETLDEFRQLFKDFQSQENKLNILKEKQIKSFQDQDLYKYQNNELTGAELQENELDILQSELKILSNVELLHQVGGRINEVLYVGEKNAASMLTESESDLKQLESLDEKFKGLSDNLAAAREAVEEIGRFTEQYLTDIEFNPQRVESIHQRIARLEFLLKKYQKSSLKDLIEFHLTIQDLVGGSEQFEEVIRQQEKKVSETLQKLNKVGEILHQKRLKAADKFDKALTSFLMEIGMPHARFHVKIALTESSDSVFSCENKKVTADQSGFDDVIFEVVSNRGESFKPIHKTASGGEISRIMLSLKSVLANADKIPTLAFDEIDAGISGKIAQVVGARLFSLAQHHQILCITHLPQIAVFGRHHLKVDKVTLNGRTSVNVKIIQDEFREKEIAQLLGGQNISHQALENARQLLQEATTIQNRITS